MVRVRQSDNAKIGRTSLPSPTIRCSDVVIFPANKSMDFIVSAPTELLTDTWRTPHFRGRIWHALTRG